VIPSRIAGIGSSVLALSGLLACSSGDGGASADPSKKEIATVGDHAVTLGQFDAYLEAVLGGRAEATAAGAELKSRMLDQYLDEEMLVAAAQERGLTVTDEEIRETLPDPNGGGPPDASRRLLLQKKFKEQVILQGVSVGAEEVRAWFEQHLDEYKRPARVLVRQILTDTEVEAKRIHAELASQPERFEEIADTRSLAPDSGKPAALDEAILTETIRAALAPMKSGELSGVVKDPQGFFIFLLVERQPEQEPSLEAAREQIELKLLQERSQRRFREFVEDLRGRMKVRINRDALDFAYVKRTAS
jgi:parvulin-like peptidyl-prolyl isomerase